MGSLKCPMYGDGLWGILPLVGVRLHLVRFGGMPLWTLGILAVGLGLVELIEGGVSTKYPHRSELDRIDTWLHDMLQRPSLLTVSTN